MEKNEIFSIIYNPTTEYGANQRSPYEAKISNPEEYANLFHIVKKHFRKKTYDEAFHLIERLKKEGCGYVCMVNSLFEAFFDKQEQFKKIFGFDMVNKDGSLNYNTVLVDLYCTMDNHIGGQFLFFTWDRYIEHEDLIWGCNKENGKFEWKERPYGNNAFQMKYRWETYCKQHGIKTKVRINRLVTPRNFEKYVKGGTVSILCNKFTLHKEDGSPVKVKNWHFMTITDVTEDKKYVVSSWGKRYTLNPREIKGLRFYQVIEYPL